MKYLGGLLAVGGVIAVIFLLGSKFETVGIPDSAKFSGPSSIVGTSESGLLTGFKAGAGFGPGLGGATKTNIRFNLNPVSIWNNIKSNLGIN